MKYRKKLMIIFFILISNQSFCVALSNKIFIKNVVKSPKPYISKGGTCLHFLKWYIKSNARKTVREIFNTRDTSMPYSVNYNILSEYLSELQKTNLVSKEFLKTVKFNYDSAATYLKLHPQYDSFVTGFKDDPIIQIAEEEMLTGHIKQVIIKKVKPIDEEKSYVEIKVSKDLSYGFVIGLYQKKWLIDSVRAIY